MRPRLVLLATLVLASCAHRRSAPREPARDVPPSTAVGAADPDASLRRPDVRTVSGEVSALGWPDPRLTLDTPSGPLTVGLDRNTLVFLESRLGTVRDLVVGLPVRAGLSGANLAAWVEVRPRGEAARGEGASAPGAPKPGASPAAEPPGAGGAGESTAGGAGRPPSQSPTPPGSAPAPGTPAGPSPVPGGTAGPSR